MIKNITFLTLVLLALGNMNVSAKPKEVKLISAYLTNGNNPNKDQYFKRAPNKGPFEQGLNIVYFANFTWENLEKHGGWHEVRWIWYSNGIPIANLKEKAKFLKSPWEIKSWIFPATLGPGNHKVELFIDDKLVDTQEFEVSE